MKDNLKILIIYFSFHNKNTEKIANEIGNVLNAKVIPFSMVNIKEIEEADLVGFGSGIYFFKFHSLLIKLIENISQMNNKNTFIFSTSGIKRNLVVDQAHQHFSKLLQSKGFNVIAHFNCLGFYYNGPLKLIGGMNKGRPNEEDLKSARSFAENLKIFISH